MVSAGWSSPVARQAHNLKVVSSNLAPATTFPIPTHPGLRPLTVLVPGVLLLLCARTGIVQGLCVSQSDQRMLPVIGRAVALLSSSDSSLL